MKTPLLSVVIISYNTQDLTIQTLESVVDSITDKLFSKNLEIIVVDNASTDDSVKQIKKFQKKSTHLKLLESKENLGFGRANNLALKTATGKYILFLNSDTIVQPGALEAMVQTFEDNPYDDTTASVSRTRKVTDRLGVLAAQLLNADKTVQPQGGKLPNLFRVLNQMLLLDDLPIIGRIFSSVQETGLAYRKAFDAPKELIAKGWVGGTAMMLPRAVLDDIGSFDPNIFMYSEDLELCLRASKHNYDVAIQPKAEIIHLGSASSSSKNAILGEIKGYLYIWSKHFPFWQKPILRSILRVGVSIRIFLFLLINQKDRSAIYSEIYRQLNSW